MKLGIVDAACPHRLASLALGRNEEGGLRCIYHGWKFDVAGRCVEMPTEPAGYSFADKVRIGSYPVRETGGIVWTYLGPPELEPRVPVDGLDGAAARAALPDQVRPEQQLRAGARKARSTPRTRGSSTAATSPIGSIA